MYKINKELLSRVRDNEYNCICAIEEKPCPCPGFIDDDLCTCGVYKRTIQ